MSKHCATSSESRYTIKQVEFKKRRKKKTLSVFNWVSKVISHMIQGQGMTFALKEVTQSHWTSHQWTHHLQQEVLDE